MRKVGLNMETAKLHISKLHIEDFKMFRGSFNMPLNKGMNILVSDNESGKSTIIQCIMRVVDREEC
jgi:predicted ATP-dependent endonuclease of OLD family